MPTLVIPEHFQVGIEMVAFGRTIMNVVGFKDVAGGSALDTTTALLAVKESWEMEDGPLKIKGNWVSMVGYHLTDLDTADGATAFLGSGAIGGLTGNEIGVISSCAVVKLSGASRDRSKNGRLFHGPIHENAINSDGRTISSGYLDSIQFAYDQFKINMNASAYPWSVLSRKHSTGALVASTGCSPILGTQKRRLR